MFTSICNFLPIFNDVHYAIDLCLSFPRRQKAILAQIKQQRLKIRNINRKIITRTENGDPVNQLETSRDNHVTKLGKATKAFNDLLEYMIENKENLFPNWTPLASNLFPNWPPSTSIIYCQRFDSTTSSLPQHISKDMRLSRNTVFSKFPCGPVIIIDKSKISSWSTSNSKYKTELYKYYIETGTCKFDGDCTFSHGSDDLRYTNHKSLLYRLFHMTNNCPYREYCAFIHDEYKRSSIIIKPGYIYAPRSIQENGDQITIDEQEYQQQRSRRLSPDYASIYEQLSI
ncbi:unnamed protein product [Rotaria sordida]|uniref:C3H1-type domain-containing protein n=2 Tax=Rotaria sordida TaxID=392033 RepID=A0A819CPL6_9BILA|nr:unnamed protein product [Rotaria sordida]